MKITNAEINVIRFSSEDVIATSGISLTSGLFYIPRSQYTGDVSGSGDYVEFNGNFTKTGSGPYAISGIYDVSAVSADDRNSLLEMSHDYVVNGVTLPWFPTLETIAGKTYDAFSYGDGVYYTNGINYLELSRQ